MTTLAILQPSYLPWLGYFDQIARSDVFVFLDDVQYDKNGWRNRNRVKSAKGPVWLTVPVRQSGRATQRILEVEIDPRQGWARKHLATIRQLYARAPFLTDYLPELEARLTCPRARLVDLDLDLIEAICGWMGLERTFHRASMLGIEGDRNERLVAMCHALGADTYLTGDAAHNYLDEGLFAASGITVQWQEYRHPVYNQLHGDFISHLSALDLLLNCGPASLAILASGKGGATLTAAQAAI